MALRVCLENLRADSSSVGSVGESVVDRRRVSSKSEPRRNSPLVGVGDDEDGEEEENKMATWMGALLRRGLGGSREGVKIGMAGNDGRLEQKTRSSMNLLMSRAFSVLLTSVSV